MDRANIIHDLLNWIENHLDQPLLLDNVAAKSGYSKWHLQRMFRSTTGHALGSYIRERRLSKAAQALRATPGRFWTLPCSSILIPSLHFPGPLKSSLVKRRRSIAARRSKMKWRSPQSTAIGTAHRACIHSTNANA